MILLLKVDTLGPSGVPVGNPPADAPEPPPAQESSPPAAPDPPPVAEAPSESVPEEPSNPEPPLETISEAKNKEVASESPANPAECEPPSSGDSGSDETKTEDVKDEPPGEDNGGGAGDNGGDAPVPEAPEVPAPVDEPTKDDAGMNSINPIDLNKTEKVIRRCSAQRQRARASSPRRAGTRIST